MVIKEEEKLLVNSGEVKNLEKVLDKIEAEEQRLIDEFDLNVENILGKDFINKLLSSIDGDIQLENRIIKTSSGKVEANYCGILTSIHKSMINDSTVRLEYEKKLKEWFSKKTSSLKDKLDHKNTFDNIKSYVPLVYSLVSLALPVFHNEANMHLRDVQKLAGIAMSNGDIAELGTGEGKTLAGILPTFLHALRGKGVHVVTANSYLSKRDYEELRPIFEGLGLSVGFVPESVEDLAKIEGLSYENISYDKKMELNKKLSLIKKKAYSSDITYGSKSAIAFDYLRDSTVTNIDDFLQRDEKPGFALIDEVDDALIDDAQCPYVLGGNLPIYTNNMTLIDLANVLNEPYEELKKKVDSSGIKIDESLKLSYEMARNISVSLYSKELIPDQYAYQKRAQRFYENQVLPRIYVVKEDNEFGINPKNLYENLTRDEKDYNFSKREKEIINNSSIIYYPAQKKFHVLDKCYEDFLTYCYFAFQINSVVKGNEQAIINDSNYVVGKDYNIINDNVFLTGSGANKIVNDPRHPEFFSDYNSYMNLVNPFASELLHYFDQAVIANLMLSSPLDYVVDNGSVKVVKNGRIQDGSVFTDGLHQALEFKEKIPEGSKTKENHTIASITQKDFYGRYDTFSGMTGTSSKKIFKEIFGKNTVSVPRNAFYEFFSSRAKKKKRNSVLEPLGVERRNTKFALDEDAKIKLIIDSIKESHKGPYPQPVLLVASNPEEVNIFSKALSRAGIKHSVLNAKTDKSKEAEIIARAGLSGAVTISQEMAGRGTDIKLGGDRNTIINIATERQIRKVEERLKKQINLSSFEMDGLRKKVEESLMNYRTPTGGRLLWSKSDEEKNRESLSSVGLKVISSGYFKIDRIDRQLEGRTGRNGAYGVCERFVCPNDLEYLGVKSIDYNRTIKEYFLKFSSNSDGSLLLDDKSLKKIDEKVRGVQTSNEEDIGMNIKSTQELAKAATNIVEKYRDDRKNILFGRISLDLRAKGMIEDVVDNLLMSYVVGEIPNKDSLLRPLSSNAINIDANAIALEAKEILGINIDVNSILASGANLLEFRNAFLDYAESRYQKLKTNSLQQEKISSAFLAADDYVISNVPTILNRSATQKSLVLLSTGLEGNEDYYANKDFYDGYSSVKLAASKIAMKKLMGIALSLDERKILDDKKDEFFGLKLSHDGKDGRYEFSDSDNIENDGAKIESFRNMKKSIEEENSKRLQMALAKADKILQNNADADVSKVYKNVNVKPMKFIENVVDSSLILVRTQPSLKSENLSKKV